MITNQNDVKTIAKHISCDLKCKFKSTVFNSNQKWNNEICQCKCKTYHKCKKDYSSNPSICIWENSKYLKSIADSSVIDCDERMSVMDIESTKMTNTIATNVTKICHSKKPWYKFDCGVLHTILSVRILLLVITMICYYYVKHRSKKIHWSNNKIRMEHNQFLKVCIKDCTCYYFDDILFRRFWYR